MDRGKRLDVAWDRRSGGLSERDRGWVQDAVFGTLRLRGRIDFVLDSLLHRGLESVAPALARVLRLGAYQILYMDSAPAYAVVSQSAEQASRLGGRPAAGLVNGVLRTLGRTGASGIEFPSIEVDPVAHLSTWGSHPEWIVERWVDRLGVECARAIVEAGNRVPGLYLRPVGLSTSEAMERLRASGIPSVRADGPAPVLALPAGTRPSAALRAVPAVVQDPASSAVCAFVGPVQDALVSDLCAAPGGKSIALLDAGARVVAMDRSWNRLRRLRETVDRLGLTLPIAVSDAERPCMGGADVVLVDAPCSGTGTFARGPDLRWRLTLETVRALSRVQARILDAAASVVRKGGRLIYSTCTLEREENRDVVDSFLVRHPGFEPDGSEAELRVLPGDISADGAFAMRMRRVA